MPSAVYAPSDMPPGTSWVYSLNAQDAVNQCHILGITPASTLTQNRTLLSDFLCKLQLNGGSEPMPDNLRPDLTKVLEPSGTHTKTSQDLMNDTVEPLVPAQTAQASLDTNTIHTTSQQHPHLPFLPGVAPFNNTSAKEEPNQAPTDWTHLVQATAMAVGQQIATAMSGTHSPPQASRNRLKVVDDLVRDLPVATGAEPRKLVEFLVAAIKIDKLGLCADEDLLMAILPRTADQMRVFWLKGISDRAKLGQVIENVRDFFLPGQVRHAIISSMVYRIQRPSESLPEFVESISGTSAFLIPHFSQQDVLDTVLNGLNGPTRAALAAFPAARSLTDLLALAPRVQMVRALEGERTVSRPDSQRSTENYRPQSHHQTFSSSRSPGYRQGAPSHRQNFAGPANRPYIPRYPFNDFRAQPPGNNQSPPSHSTNPNRQSNSSMMGQGNDKGGHR